MWKMFLSSQVKELVALDFFVVPTVTYKVLFVLLMLSHHADASRMSRSTRTPLPSGPLSHWSRSSHGMRPRSISYMIGPQLRHCLSATSPKP